MRERRVCSLACLCLCLWCSILCFYLFFRKRAHKVLIETFRTTDIELHVSTVFFPEAIERLLCEISLFGVRFKGGRA